jgi:hypothetical protein
MGGPATAIRSLISKERILAAPGGGRTSSGTRGNQKTWRRKRMRQRAKRRKRRRNWKRKRNRKWKKRKRNDSRHQFLHRAPAASLGAKQPPLQAATKRTKGRSERAPFFVQPHNRKKKQKKRSDGKKWWELDSLFFIFSF